MICTLGDLLLDVIVRLGAPLARGGDAPAETLIGPGGQAANVAAWVAHLGGTARFVGVRSADAAGLLVADELERRGVELAGPRVRRARAAWSRSWTGRGSARWPPTAASPPSCVPRISPRRGSAAATGCTCRATACCARRSTAPRAGPRGRPVRRGRGSASTSRRGARSVTSGRRRSSERLAVIAPDVVFANEEELEVMGEPPQVPVLVIKRGCRGV